MTQETVEERLRDAMAARVATVDAPEYTLGPRSPRRIARAALAGGFVLAVALVVGLALLPSGDDGVRPADARPYPSRILAVTFDGRLIVASARNGHALRTLATDADGAGGVTMSPDGTTVYYARNTANRCGTGDLITTIASIPITGGTSTDLVSNVRYPSVSPDGRYLAFTGIPNCSDAGRSILVRDLYSTTHVNGSFDGVWGPRSSASPWVAIQSLSWAPDSRHILFTHASSTSAGTEDALPRLLDTRAPFQTYLDTAPVVPVSPYVACCFLGTKDSLAGSALDSGGFARDVIAIDAHTGARTRTLTCCGEVIATDPTGRALLIHFTDTTHPGGIYRWTPHQRRPVLLGSLFATATWIPGR